MGKPTINDVARLAGVSKKTVSRVINDSPLLNPATREKVEKVIAELGYVPNPQARALALRRNFLIALVHDGSDPQQALTAQTGMLAALAGSGYALAIAPVSRDMQRAAPELRTFIEQHRPAGVLLLPPVSEHAALAEVCLELDCHYVRFGATALDDPAHLVASQDRAATAQAVGYLVALGHQRIGFIAGPEESATAQQRELGYLDAMADHDLDRGPALIASGDLSFESGLSAGRLLLQVSPRPTAIFAACDAMAAGVLHAAREQGVAVPEALSIVGFGDSPLAAQLWPALTTVRVPVADMAGIAARKLSTPEAANSLPAQFHAELVARASAAPAQG